MVAARKLQRRRRRDETGLFLVEGPRAVREALADASAAELFATIGALSRRQELATLVGELVDAAGAQGVPVWPIADEALATLTETVTPQGLVAVCRHRHRELSDVLSGDPRLVVVLAGIADPGNAGTVLRTADAAGAGAVVFPDGAVDPYNGKCVRSSAGSLFHVDLVRGGDAVSVVASLRSAGLAVLAADLQASIDLYEYDGVRHAGTTRVDGPRVDGRGLAARTAWLFGSEAHGLSADLAASADARVRVPMYGRAESLNLAAAAAVCLYASARAQRHTQDPRD